MRRERKSRGSRKPGAVLRAPSQKNKLNAWRKAFFCVMTEGADRAEMAARHDIKRGVLQKASAGVSRDEAGKSVKQH